MSVVYKGLWVCKADLSCPWGLHISMSSSRACLGYALEVWRWPLCCLLPEAGDEDACLEPCSFWTSSSQVSLIGVEFEVRAPEIDFPETWGVQPQGFYLSLSLAWLQGKAEWTLQARSLQMQKIIGFKMSLAVHIMDILWILWLAVVFSWPMLPSWCNL